MGALAEGLLDGIVRVVGDGADLAAAQVLEDQALEEVVDIGHGKRELDLCPPGRPSNRG